MPLTIEIASGVLLGILGAVAAVALLRWSFRSSGGRAVVAAAAIGVAVLGGTYAKKDRDRQKVDAARRRLAHADSLAAAYARIDFLEEEAALNRLPGGAEDRAESDSLGWLIWHTPDGRSIAAVCSEPLFSPLRATPACMEELNAASGRADPSFVQDLNIVAKWDSAHR